MTWVRQNIATFGGDSHNVTIFGESAGSFDASLLMTTPLSKGLFERVIAESGSVVLGEKGFEALGAAEKSGELRAAGWHVRPGGSLNALRAMSAEEILKSDPDPNSITDPLGRADIPGAVVDGYVFLESPIRTFMQGKEHRVALLHGSNSGDGVSSSQTLNLLGAITATYGPLAERVNTLYTVGTDPVYGSASRQWLADTQFRCPAVTQLLWHSAAGNPSYQYEFARTLPGLEGTGAFHSQEITYVFGTVERGVAALGGRVLSTNAVDKRISDGMQQYWTNFAQTGDPNGGGVPVWPKFDPSSRAYIQFTDAGPIAKEGLRRTQCDLFVENVQRLMAR